ncbi:hypothetical protein ACJRO7_002254 [Eucalyptus globulus]|uniref:BHLH domain-containing protein n=1 Tax=Eucalyptus globulus TaxID=34317 RepID=A0ABD3LZ01_EUCGL
MLSCSPSNWPFEDSTSHEQENYMRRDAHPFSSPPPLHFAFLSSPSPHAEVVLDHLNIPAAATNGEATMVKKLNHNACERDRRKKINSLYSALRLLLPSADQTEKLSIPATVSQVLKYIPELQQQVQILTREREELLSRINATQGIDDCTHQEISKGKGALSNPMPSISTNCLSESEVAIQICTTKVMTQNTVDFSEILLNLDHHGFPLINASTFESFGGTRTTFYNLHVQVERSRGTECEALKEKLLALYDQKGREVKFLIQH